ncbi:Pentatricopeptide repeat-containing protein [Nymphaea thermarum]|nr:Pentatricopeptide repeat-containing protein [Nymphaea thermarum]
MTMLKMRSPFRGRLMTTGHAEQNTRVLFSELFHQTLDTEQAEQNGQLREGINNFFVPSCSELTLRTDRTQIISRSPTTPIPTPIPRPLPPSPSPPPPPLLLHLRLHLPCLSPLLLCPYFFVPYQSRISASASPARTASRRAHGLQEQHLGERIACKNVAASSPNLDPLETRFRSVLPTLLCSYVSPSSPGRCFSNLGRLEDARKLFDESTRRNIVSWNAMLTGYAKVGDVESARQMFDEMPQRDVVSWNAMMIACYSQCNRSIEVLLLFDEMQAVCVNPTEATLVCIVSACADLGALDRGKRLHSFLDAHRIKLNTVLGYTACADLGTLDRGKRLHSFLDAHRIKLNTVLGYTACADLGALDRGKRLHSFLDAHRIKLNTVLSTAMYAKCGSIEEAIQVFHLIPKKDVLSWNTIIAGLAMHGHVKGCYQLFMQMIQSGSEPDDITFVAMLSSYSHAGMVEEGLRLLGCMSSRFNVTPKAEHYGCVIDLLCHAGLLEKVMELIVECQWNPMPVLGEHYLVLVESMVMWNLASGLASI